MLEGGGGTGGEKERIIQDRQVAHDQGFGCAAAVGACSELRCSGCQRGSGDSTLGGSCRRDGAASLCGSKRRGAEVVPARLGKSTSDLLMCERPSRGSASMIVSPSRPTPAGVWDRRRGGMVVVPGICVGTQRARAISPVREVPLSPVRKEIGDRGSRAETPSPRRVDHRCATPVIISAGDQVAPRQNTPSNKTMVMEISRNPECASPHPRRGQARARVLGRLV
jgi:hypothetical protein